MGDRKRERDFSSLGGAGQGREGGYKVNELVCGEGILHLNREATVKCE